MITRQHAEYAVLKLMRLLPDKPFYPSEVDTCIMRCFGRNWPRKRTNAIVRALWRRGLLRQVNASTHFWHARFVAVPR